MEEKEKCSHACMQQLRFLEKTVALRGANLSLHHHNLVTKKM
jgi:hypothetical protein